jgi:hypothetical protein
VQCRPSCRESQRRRGGYEAARPGNWAEDPAKVYFACIPILLHRMLVAHVGSRLDDPVVPHVLPVLVLLNHVEAAAPLQELCCPGRRVGATRRLASLLASQEHEIVLLEFHSHSPQAICHRQDRLDRQWACKAAAWARIAVFQEEEHVRSTPKRVNEVVFDALVDAGLGQGANSSRDAMCYSPWFFPIVLWRNAPLVVARSSRITRVLTCGRALNSTLSGAYIDRANAGA